MQSVIRSFSIAVLLVFFTVASAQLPPEIRVDRYLILAEKYMGDKDYESAFNVMKKILALQKEHNLTLPDEFHFKYARVALSAGHAWIALESVKQYLSAKRKEGQFYKEALALLNKVEQMLPLEPEMVVIPAGRFMMGTGSYRHEVRIASFELSKYEVTFEEYDAFTDATGRMQADDEGWGRGQRPVINISWHDARAYVAWLSKQTGKTYRLPSEAEWEYGARAGTTTNYSWGNEIGINRANCNVCGSQWDAQKTAPVGSFEPNGWGLYDMHGNVWEWVQDCWNDNYEGAPTDGSAWMSGNCSEGVLRGGSWGSRPSSLRSASRARLRQWYSPQDRLSVHGFRVARSF